MSESSRRLFLRSLSALGLAPQQAQTTPQMNNAEESVLPTIGELQLEITARRIIHRTPSVFYINSRSAVSRLPGGSGWLVLGTRSAIQSFREAAQRSNVEVLAQLASKHSVEFEEAVQRRSPYPSRAEVPVISRLTYGTKELVDNWILPEGCTAVIAVIPYTGGKIKNSEFQFTQFVRYQQLAQLDALVILRAPTLTKLERGVLKKVPSKLSDTHIGVPPNVQWQGVAAALGLLFTAYLVGTYLASKVHEDTEDYKNQNDREADDLANNNNDARKEGGQDNQIHKDVDDDFKDADDDDDEDDDADDDDQDKEYDDNSGRWRGRAQRRNKMLLPTLNKNASAKDLLRLRGLYLLDELRRRSK
jgi:hypothetical protein